MRKKLNYELIRAAFTGNMYYKDPNRLFFLNKDTQDVRTIFISDEAAEYFGDNPAENKYYREQIRNNPKQYLLIEGLDPDAHRWMLVMFLDSNWSHLEEQKKIVRECYQGSIQDWERQLKTKPELEFEPTTIIGFWRMFREEKIQIMIEKFLIDNNIKFSWC